MNLVIDVGNSAIKLAVFKKNQILSKSIIKHDALEIGYIELHKQFEIRKTIVCSVTNLNASEEQFLKNQDHILFLDNKTSVPFTNLYATPETLGADRIALISEATFKYPKQAVLVIDAGSCITYDYKNEKDEYLGGAISPGLSMRYKAVHYFTGKLPLLSRDSSHKFIGNTTNSAIHAGIENGIVFEMNGMIDKYLAENEKLTIILTGGDAEYLRHHLKNCIFANSNFLLEGLNDILDYN
ncbi:MAG: type III pantothenate kinase [Flavobacteriaceae bacterium]|nr:type III pantothenate kinase [Flavobacteriaceae bacterium]